MPVNMPYALDPADHFLTEITSFEKVDRTLIKARFARNHVLRQFAAPPGYSPFDPQVFRRLGINGRLLQPLHHHRSLIRREPEINPRYPKPVAYIPDNVTRQIELFHAADMLLRVDIYQMKEPERLGHIFQ